MFSTEQIAARHGRLLLRCARESIAFGIRHGHSLVIDTGSLPEVLRVPRATFVTLKILGELRGCIGSIRASQPLILDLTQNAYAAAFSDPRFPPLGAREFHQLAIHISILTEPEPLECDSEQDLLDKLRPHIDGVILEEADRRGTFLPAVWKSLPSPRSFVEHLKQKAGLPADYWSDQIRIYRYQTHTVPNNLAAD